MVADRVEVTSRKAGSEEAWTWASDGRGSSRWRPPSARTPGTDIVLHIKGRRRRVSGADAAGDGRPQMGRPHHRADHLARDGKDQPANEGTALWRKPKSEVTAEAV